MPTKVSSLPSNEEVHVYKEVKLQDLPSFRSLSEEVSKVVKASSWWERHGIDWMYIIGSFAAVPIALQILKHDSLLAQALGTIILGCFHCIITNKSGHIAAHGGLGGGRLLNKFWMHFSVEFMGAFSADSAEDIHIKMHHPHTNIIDLGDSSTWKIPFLTRGPYLFLAPLLMPIFIPLVSLQQLVSNSKWLHLVKYLAVTAAGYALHLQILREYCGYSLSGALFVSFIYRAMFSLPYIHMNIFQHIGLPMYSQKDRPARIYQMSSGCLNLSRNSILDHVMGHSLVNCHVEHHLFPRLSDEMCLKVKPIVSKFLKENNLPYNEKSYLNRLSLFWKDYERLMVNAPPITHFVGLQ